MIQAKDPSSENSNGELQLSIVVETANTPPGDYRELDVTLEALSNQTLPNECFEIIVVADPNLHPGLRGHLRDFSPRVEMVDAPRSHYYAQKNCGARHARGRIVGFMDSDCIPVRTWAEAVLNAFESGNSTLGAAQGTVNSERSALGFAFVITNFALFQTREPRFTKGLTGNNCAFRRIEFLKCPFEENPTFHGSDVRMAARIHECGKKILLIPSAANHHHFLPGFKLFLSHGVYWGYCFVSLRRDGAAGVPYARFFRRLGFLSPIILAPAKAGLDLWRLFRLGSILGLKVTQTVGCAMALIVNSLAVCWGATRAVLGLGPPTSPTSSNTHLDVLPARLNR